MNSGKAYYRRFLNGEDEGLTLIIKEYKDGLTLYLNSYVNNIYIAEDLMQETFYKIAVKKPKFQEKSSFKTWLYTIGRNLAIDYLRRAKNHTLTPIDILQNYIKDETNIEALYIKNERKKLLHKAMLTLKPEYQQILWLVFFDCFSIDESALVMKKSKKQTENLFFRAKQALKTKLEKEGLEYERL